VVQRSEQECMKLVGRVRLKLGSNRSLALLQPPSQQGYKYEEAPRAALPLTRHQCSIHCESSQRGPRRKQVEMGGADTKNRKYFQMFDIWQFH